MNNDYCIMYNEGFGLAVEAFSLKNDITVSCLTVGTYVNIQTGFGQFE